MECIMDVKTEMKTLSACTKMLEDKGFKTQFLVLGDSIKSLASDRIYKPEQVKIINFYRFEGNSNPDDNSILYVIETISGELGMLIDAYGAQADIAITKFIGQVASICKKEHLENYSTLIINQNASDSMTTLQSEMTTEKSLTKTTHKVQAVYFSDMGIGYKLLDVKR